MSRRDVALALLRAGVVVIGLSLLLGGGGWRVKLATGIEALLYFAVFYVVLSRDAVRSHLAAVPRPHRRLLTIFFVLLLAGHFINSPRGTFPFSAWTMYGRPESPDTLVFYRSRGIDRNDGRVVIDEAELFPSIGGSAIASKVKRLAAQVLAAPDRGGAAERQGKLTDWLRAVGNTYNRRHPEGPVQAIELVRYSLNLRDQGKSGLTGQPIWRIELGGEPPR